MTASPRGARGTSTDNGAAPPTSRTAARAEVTLTPHRAAGLSAATREEIGHFVVRFIDYPRARLDAALDAADYVWIGRDETGRLVATTAIRAIETALGSRTVTVIYTSMVAVSPDCRRLGLVNRMGFRSYVRERLRAPLRPVFWLALAASPAGYLQMAHSYETCWPRRGHAAPKEIVALLDDLAVHLKAPRVERVAGCHRLPDDFGVSDPTQEASRWDRSDPDVDFFLRVNPDYRRGSDLMCIAPLSIANVVRSLLRSTARAAARRVHERPFVQPGSAP